MVVYWNNRSRSLNSGFVNYKLSYLVSVLQRYSDTKKTKGFLTWCTLVTILMHNHVKLKCWQNFYSFCGQPHYIYLPIWY